MKTPRKEIEKAKNMLEDYKVRDANNENFQTWDEFEKELNLTPEEEARINFETKLLGALIEARKKVNITQAELSKRTGIKQSAIARLESGKQSPTTDTLLKILGALGYTLEIVPIKNKN